MSRVYDDEGLELMGSSQQLPGGQPGERVRVALHWALRLYLPTALLSVPSKAVRRRPYL